MKDKIILKDNNGIDVEVDVKTFVIHIQKYHDSGVSVHEEREDITLQLIINFEKC